MDQYATSTWAPEAVNEAKDESRYFQSSLLLTKYISHEGMECQEENVK